MLTNPPDRVAKSLSGRASETVPDEASASLCLSFVTTSRFASYSKEIDFCEPT